MIICRFSINMLLLRSRRMKLWRFSTDISLPQSERLEAKWLHINLPNLSIQPERAGNFTNPIGAETEFSG
jgi:hypothetical protein